MTLRYAAGSLVIGVLLLSALLAAHAQAPEPRFYFGVDLSYANEMDDCGAEYRENGELRDPFDLFSERGATLVRARLWHNPDW
ncbi:MAG: glycosyl hydrolase 53 family protein, partial [Anaerolineae bacterium]|nr:glycosyl hydrolase 53 family protein [Anaerolineae bacterium]